jgi:hypothetical protein
MVEKTGSGTFPADFRYIPKDMVIIFDDEVASNSWTTFGFTETADLKDKSAGRERSTSYNVAKIDREWEMELFDEHANAQALSSLFRAGKIATLKVMPLDNLEGKPLISFVAVVEKREQTWAHDDNAMYKVSGKINGDLIDDFSVVPAG